MQNKSNKPALFLSNSDWLLLILLSLIWGSSFLFIRVAVLEIPPLTLVLARVSIAAAALSMILVFRTSSFQHNANLWMSFAIMGLLNNVIPFTFIFYGQLEIGAGLAATINVMTPIWTIIIAHLASRDERFSFNKVLGILLGFIGVAILIGVDFLSGLNSSAWAQMLILGATISYGFAGVFGRRFASTPPMQTARGQLTMSSIIMLPLVLYIDTPWNLSLPSSRALWSVFILATICTGFAYIIYFRILRSAGAVNLALVTFLIPPSAVILGMVFLQEQIQIHQILGLLVILAGLAVIDGRLLKQLNPLR